MTTPDYPHLHITKEKPVTDRRPAGGWEQPRQPDDPRVHGRRLQQRLDSLLGIERDI